MSFTQAEVLSRIEEHKSFIEHVAEIFRNYIIAQDGRSYLCSDSISFEGESVFAEGYNSSKYADQQHYNYSMPISMLWQPDLAAAMADERQKKDEAARRLALEQQALKAQQAEQREKSEFLRLKAKYEVAA